MNLKRFLPYGEYKEADAILGRMDYFSVLKDSDIFGDQIQEPEEYRDRLTVKGLVFDKEDKIALLCHPVEKYGLFPGGGVEVGETKEEALLRECREEIGCKVEIVSYLGCALQFQSKISRKNVIHFFIAKVVGEKGAPTTTQNDELSATTVWMTKDKLFKQLEEQIAFTHPEWYQRQFNSRTHFAALNKFLKS